MSDSALAPASARVQRPLVPRHRLATRLWHWTNLVALIVLLMSGLMIFNAHPRLYWGQFGAWHDPAWLAIGHADGAGFLRIGTWQIDTTGWLGLWPGEDGNMQATAFPSWMTLPSFYDLALARRWHLSTAWVFTAALGLFALFSLLNGHFYRDLILRRGECRPREFWQCCKDHARLRFHTTPGETYNTLQKAAYLGVLLVLVSTVLTGLAMSPAMAASWPWLLDIWGGRQSARSVHFLCAAALVLFFFVHVLMVLAYRPLSQLRAMVTGWWPDDERDAQ